MTHKAFSRQVYVAPCQMSGRGVKTGRKFILKDGVPVLYMEDE